MFTCTYIVLANLYPLTSTHPHPHPHPHPHTHTHTKACGRFVNSNAVTQGPRASSKSPELLARYCDMLLKKRSVPTNSQLNNTDSMFLYSSR